MRAAHRLDHIHMGSAANVPEALQWLEHAYSKASARRTLHIDLSARARSVTPSRIWSRPNGA
jgi:hypothetical protein